MKKRIWIIISAIVLISIFVLVVTYDVHFQIHGEFNKMLKQSEQELSNQYGSDVAAFFNSYHNEGFEKPDIFYMKFENNIYMVLLTTYKYSDEKDSFGSVLDSQITSLYFEFDKVPLLSFDKLKEITTRAEFETVVMYDAFSEFISKSKDSKKDTDVLYKEIILDSVCENFLDGGEYEKLAAQYIGRTMRQLDDLTYKLALLKEKNVEMIVNDALLKSNSYLTGINTTVYIFPSAGDYEQLTDQGGGVSGVTIGSGKIMILVDPTVDNWESMLSYVVAHEYHHSIWTSQNLAGFGITLLDHLVVEGRADSFANIVYPEFDVPWTSSIDLKTENIIWKLIDDQLGKINGEVINKVMFGDGMDYPQWSGYTIGYHIVQNYLEKNPEVNVETWTNMSSSDILEKSGYVKSQN
jgi:uncharacterized protein YjaZ